MIETAAWHDGLRRHSVSEAGAVTATSTIVAFRDTEPRIRQPALDRDVLAIHLGGPKRVIRTQGGRSVEVDVAENAVTLMPANEAFDWETFGPIAFAHLVLEPADLERAALEEGVGVAHARPDPFIGSADPRLVLPFLALLRGADRPETGRLYRDVAAAALAQNVVERAPGARRGSGNLGRAKLATWQLRRVVDHMRAHLGDDVRLDTLVALSGVGRARFFRGFRASIGQAPFEYLLSLRLLEARRLLLEKDWPIVEVAATVGLEPTRLAAAFRKRYRTTPGAFRAASRPA